MIDTVAIRNKILELALQGRLSTQNRNDESADALIESILEENTKTYTPIEEKKPFDIPNSWRWIYLGDLCSAVTGKLDVNQQNADGEYPFFTCGVEVYKTLEYAFDCDAILLGGNNASGDYKMHRYNGKFNAYQRVYVITDPPHEVLDYLFYVVRYWLPHLKYNSQGAMTRFIRIGQVNGMLVPFPPKFEQIRIVEILDSAFSILDTIDELQSDYLTDVEMLKNKIMKTALTGRLSRQYEKDGTASEFLSKIEGYKELVLDEESTPPYEIPQNWSWCTFSQIVEFNLGKTPARGNSSYWSDGEYSWVSIGDMSSRGYITSTKEKVSQKAYDECFSKGLSPKGTLIMSFKLSIGKVAILDTDSFHNEAIISIYPRYDEDDIFKNYLYWVLPTIAQNTEAHGAIKGNTLNKTSLSGMMIPIPPLQEQKRIVGVIRSISKVFSF